MKELSIFVDESGDFDSYDHKAPFYIISLVLHDQENNIQSELKLLEESLSNLGWPHHCVHAGPLIRSEEEYRGYDLQSRQKIFKRMMSSVFNAMLENVEFRKVLPADYRLFQVADLICTLSLTELKSDAHILSKSEKYFFGDARTLRKNYLKPLSNKKI